VEVGYSALNATKGKIWVHHRRRVASAKKMHLRVTVAGSPSGATHNPRRRQRHPEGSLKYYLMAVLCLATGERRTQADPEWWYAAFHGSDTECTHASALSKAEDVKYDAGQ
jgi:hypothetical protein